MTGSIELELLPPASPAHTGPVTFRARGGDGAETQTMNVLIAAEKAGIAITDAQAVELSERTGTAPYLGQPLYEQHCKTIGVEPKPWKSLNAAVQEFWASAECDLLQRDVDVYTLYGIGVKEVA